MADLNRPDRERAQMILIAGFALAMTFVALALILNSVIFTENLATRSESVGGTGPVGVRDTLGEGIGSLLSYVNAHNNTAKPAPRDTMLTASEDLENVSGPLYASRGEILRVEYVDETNGSRYAHDDTSRAFISADGTSADWRLVDDAARIRSFGVNVSRDSLVSRSNCNSDNCLRVEVDNTDSWTITVSRDGSDVVVDIANTAGSVGECRATGETVEINLTTGWVGDTKCQALDFAQGVNGDYDVYIQNGDDATGRYSLVTTEETSSVSRTHLNGPGSSGSPRVTHALYSVTMRITYAIGGLDYQSNVSIAPGEPP